MRVMIAGGAGYVGSVLHPALASRGHEAVVADAMWFGEPNNVNVETHVGDCFELTPADLEGFGAVVFLGGLSNDPMADFSPRMNFEMNAALPAYLGYVARQAGVRRFVFASSCSVYGYYPNELSVECGPTKTTTPYGLSKLAAERALLNMASDDFSVIALRKGTISGYSPRMRLDLLLNTMLKTALTNGEVFVSNPAVWRPLLGIQDAVRGYIRSLEAPEEISGTFNLASGNFTLGHLGDVVRDYVQSELGLPCTLRIGDVQEIRSYKVDTEKARVELGFESLDSPKTILEELGRQRGQFEDMESDRYYNIRVFTKLAAAGQVKV